MFCQHKANFESCDFQSVRWRTKSHDFRWVSSALFSFSKNLEHKLFWFFTDPAKPSKHTNVHTLAHKSMQTTTHTPPHTHPGWCFTPRVIRPERLLVEENEQQLDPVSGDFDPQQGADSWFLIWKFWMKLIWKFWLQQRSWSRSNHPSGCDRLIVSWNPCSSDCCRVTAGPAGPFDSPSFSPGACSGVCWRPPAHLCDPEPSGAAGKRRTWKHPHVTLEPELLKSRTGTVSMQWKLCFDVFNM